MKETPEAVAKDCVKVIWWFAAGGCCQCRPNRLCCHTFHIEPDHSIPGQQPTHGQPVIFCDWLMAKCIFFPLQELSFGGLEGFWPGLLFEDRILTMYDYGREAALSLL